MKIIKISAIWCSACLVMNKVWKNLSEKYDIEIIELDYDIDEEKVKLYQVGDILPVVIIEKDNQEVKRIIGEKSQKELEQILKELEFSEKN